MNFFAGEDDNNWFPLVDYIFPSNDNMLRLTPGIIKQTLGIYDVLIKIQDPDISCSICSDDFILNSKKSVYPVCKHSFHSECIDKWILEKGTLADCPICRSSILNEAATELKKDHEWKNLDLLEKIKKVRDSRMKDQIIEKNSFRKENDSIGDSYSCNYDSYCR